MTAATVLFADASDSAGTDLDRSSERPTARALRRSPVPGSDPVVERAGLLLCAALERTAAASPHTAA